jgi:hypothetical protein
MLAGIIKSLHRSTSPAKTLSAATKKLETFFSRSEVRGNVQLINNRHVKFRLAFPKTEGSGIDFCSMEGEINARTGAVNFNLISSIKISLHALQRLIERLDDQSDTAILDEIYSSMAHVNHWHKGATAVKAKCWPLISKNGFFIGACSDDSQTTTVITWIKANGEKLGKKWGLPLDNLLKLREVYPARFADFEFIQEFIRSFPWMLYEHVPGEDLIATAWERREDSPDQIDDEENKCEEESGLWESKLPTKLSASYVTGLNYTALSPPFSTHSQHKGVVVQKRSGGQLIVGLRNGWVGFVPLQSLQRGMQLISGFKVPEIGQDIDVLVHKILYRSDEQAYSVSLDPKDIADANWIEIQKSHPIGRQTNVILILKLNHQDEYIAQLDNGIRGVIPAAEVQEKMNQPALYACNPIGTKWNVEIVGYREEKKSLLLSLRYMDCNWQPCPRSVPYQAGDEVIGICIRKERTYAVIELSEGLRGILHVMNNWGNDLPAVNSSTSATFILFNFDSGTAQLAGVPPHGPVKAFYANPDSKEGWIDFTSKHESGDVIEVQVLFWQEASAGFLVCTQEGIVGRLPYTEIDWLCSKREAAKLLLAPGDFLNVKIVKLELESRKLVFSKRVLEKNLVHERLVEIDTGCAVCGLIVTVLDYGCFVLLQPYGIQGLLHRTEIPEGRTLTKGDFIDVFIKVIDLSKNRVSLSLLG